MKPPIVYEVTRPNPHRTMRRTAKVQSMIASLSGPENSKQRAAGGQRYSSCLVPRCQAIPADVARVRIRRADLAGRAEYRASEGDDFYIFLANWWHDVCRDEIHERGKEEREDPPVSDR